MIRTISAAAPKAADVLALAGRLEGARNSEDAAYDVHPIAVAAGRLLDFGGIPKRSAYCELRD